MIYRIGIIAGTDASAFKSIAVVAWCASEVIQILIIICRAFVAGTLTEKNNSEPGIYNGESLLHVCDYDYVGIVLGSPFLRSISTQKCELESENCSAQRTLTYWVCLNVSYPSAVVAIVTKPIFINSEFALLVSLAV